eukprot:CAMPEP_0206452852 /NCGR_PEP_ID=MMETSP0324_2-20121206/20192_1 /ASSEMBLY_ACC=CAM_ASM_000836 /TAXON_ID=2866 /ORGANISM="Crypthecodinium cohnii, Strain Seligo" /LENGTH=91 /DNA_ID=CAMNT_0053923021 /DNA_START=348 /DNA_END=622 /DNA_ORIENTATION=-
MQGLQAEQASPHETCNVDPKESGGLLKIAQAKRLRQEQLMAAATDGDLFLCRCSILVAAFLSCVRFYRQPEAFESHGSNSIVSGSHNDRAG